MKRLAQPAIEARDRLRRESFRYPLLSDDKGRRRLPCRARRRRRAPHLCGHRRERGRESPAIPGAPIASRPRSTLRTSPWLGPAPSRPAVPERRSIPQRSALPPESRRARAREPRARRSAPRLTAGVAETSECEKREREEGRAERRCQCLLGAIGSPRDGTGSRCPDRSRMLNRRPPYRRRQVACLAPSMHSDPGARAVPEPVGGAFPTDQPIASTVRRPSLSTSRGGAFGSWSSRSRSIL